jgi:hypothetical protein
MPRRDQGNWIHRRGWPVTIRATLPASTNPVRGPGGHRWEHHSYELQPGTEVNGAFDLEAQMKLRVTYANVVSTLALLIALSGGAGVAGSAGAVSELVN